MKLYRKKPLELFVAEQWMKNGDHSLDESKPLVNKDGAIFLSEGKLVRYFRHPNVSGETLCFRCQQKLDMHGWIDPSRFLTSETHGCRVCPGDFVIKDSRDAFSVMNRKDFMREFEEVVM